jgi:cytochrome c-type biogenesis protein CcmH/NrfF
MKISRFFLLLFLALLASLEGAEIAEQQQTRIEHLEHAVLAPCCYTESVAVHQSEIAVKMRLEIAKWVEMGKSDREILDTYVGLYGSKVLVDPRTSPAWWTPWVPWVVLAIGTVLLTWFLKRWRLKVEASRPASDLERQSLPDIEDEDVVL